MKRRFLSAAMITGVGFVFDQLLWRYYANDMRIMKHYGIDEQRKNMKEYKGYINEK